MSDNESLIKEIDDMITGKVKPRPDNQSLVDEIESILNSGEHKNLIKYEK